MQFLDVSPSRNGGSSVAGGVAAGDSFCQRVASATRWGTERPRHPTHQLGVRPPAPHGRAARLNTWEGWLYLATVINLASRRVVGWAVADNLKTDLVDAALADALQRRRPADRLVFIPTAAIHQRSARGQCWDNAVPSRSSPRLNRTHPPAGMAHPHRCPAGNIRVHRRLVQHPSPTSQSGLPQPGRLRNRHQSPAANRPQGSLRINTSTLSVEPDQAQSGCRRRVSACCIDVTGRVADGWSPSDAVSELTRTSRGVVIACSPRGRIGRGSRLAWVPDPRGALGW